MRFLLPRNQIGKNGNFGEKGFCGFNKKSKTKMKNVNSPWFFLASIEGFEKKKIHAKFQLLKNGGFVRYVWEWALCRSWERRWNTFSFFLFLYEFQYCTLCNREYNDNMFSEKHCPRYVILKTVLNWLCCCWSRDSWHVHTEEIVPRKTFILARNQVSSDFFGRNYLHFL